jgi:hypothetical protein
VLLQWQSCSPGLKLDGGGQGRGGSKKSEGEHGAEKVGVFEDELRDRESKSCRFLSGGQLLIHGICFKKGDMMRHAVQALSVPKRKVTIRARLTTKYTILSHSITSSRILFHMGKGPLKNILPSVLRRSCEIQLAPRRHSKFP